ncbi:insulinase family protein [Granulosicoccus sp.]|nr:insulinase family protein [Granulosicoccus sp.]
MKSISQTLVLLIMLSAQASAELVELNTEAEFKTVYFSEDQSASSVTVALFVIAGEVDVQGPEGLSHYLEHLMFWHADSVNGDALHSRGGNAWVNGIVTSYYNRSESIDLPDMLEFINRLYSPPVLKKDFMLRERSVVAREYDLRVSENPDTRAYTAIRRGLYNQHPLSRSVIGTPESISSLTIDQAEDFHQSYYHPQNSVLFISGNLPSQTVIKAVNEKLGHLTAGDRYVQEWRGENIASDFDHTTQVNDGQVDYEQLIYLTLSKKPNFADPVRNWYTLRLLESIIDSALPGGIARPLRMDSFILRTFGLNIIDTLQDYFEFSLFAAPDKGVTLQHSTEKIADTLHSIAEKGIPQETLERVKKRMLQTAERNANDFDSNYIRLAEQLSAGVTPVIGNQHLNHIKAVTLEDVNDYLDALANPERRAIAHIKPTGS